MTSSSTAEILRDTPIRAASILDQLSPEQLVAEAIANGEGELTSTGALMCATGSFTGRSPKDKFLVLDEKTENSVWWGKINQPFSPDAFEALYQKMLAFIADKKVYTRKAFAGADPTARLSLQIINTQAWQNLFCHHMFIRPTEEELAHFTADFTILCVPEFLADPEIDQTRQSNFTIVDMTRRILLIGGTGYAGEMKKGIFTVLNYILPEEKGYLSMHCSANVGQDGDTAIFFGLSGTGKTTLSTDPNRQLIGDDEHGWSDDAVFNFEGGCYAKVIDLSPEQEPAIYKAIQNGAIVENTVFKPGTNEVNYADTSLTLNTRTAYPLYHIENSLEPSIAGAPKNIFLLTYDAFGVIPPISRLNADQAMYHFVSGYTSKVAGTEMGVTDPEVTFSACFGAAFLPLHPTKYAKLLGKKIKEGNARVWLINTGLVGGGFGVGKRMPLAQTRAMITAALNGDLEKVSYTRHPIFGMMIPDQCPFIAPQALLPWKTWADETKYNEAATKLAEKFQHNFEQFSDLVDPNIQSGGPILSHK